MKQNIAIGVDIGGSHISCAAVDLTKGKILRETFSERSVNNQAQATRIIADWASCLADVFMKIPVNEVKGIGIAMPGPFDYVNGICLIKGVAKYENLYGFNIADAIISSLDVPDSLGARFINDASAFAVGEAWAGKASKADRSVSITLGTGFGSAFIDNRIPIVEGPDVPELGCVYHIPYKGSFADEFFSTRGFIRSFTETTGKEAKGVKEIANLASTDETAKRLFAEFGNDLGFFLAPLLKRFKAEILVIGGNISNAYGLFGNNLEASLINERCRCKVEVSELKQDAALLGSAYLFEDNFWKAIQDALPLM